MLGVLRVVSSKPTWDLFYNNKGVGHKPFTRWYWGVHVKMATITK